MEDRTGRVHRHGAGMGHWEPGHFVALFLAALGFVFILSLIL